MNISGFSQTSPKIQFRALHSMRGENSHISYMGDNFFRSQIVALLSSFRIWQTRSHSYYMSEEFWSVRYKEKKNGVISTSNRHL